MVFPCIVSIMDKLSPQTNKQGFLRVLAVISKSKLASGLGISRQAITNWGDEVPEAYAFRISILTNIPIEEIVPETVAKMKKIKETS